MKILYLLFPLLLLLVHSAAGSSLAPTNKKQCEKEKGYCGFLKCSFPYGIAGKCSRFLYCYPEIGKQHMALASGSWTHILMSPCPDVPCPGCLCRAQLG
uniref:Uncharacterized protein n=1 Tax=Cyanoderma ruficeps TaxID=181631 RepID=A0A8C3R2E8_9PASS